VRKCGVRKCGVRKCGVRKCKYKYKCECEKRLVISVIWHARKKKRT
jgi:hypothetical protein